MLFCNYMHAQAMHYREVNPPVSWKGPRIELSKWGMYGSVLCMGWYICHGSRARSSVLAVSQAQAPKLMLSNRGKLLSPSNSSRANGRCHETPEE